MSVSDTPRNLPDDEQIARWMSRQPSRERAAACVRHALAFNTLDAGWLSGAFAPLVTYDSQHAFETLNEHRHVFAYLRRKIDSFRNNRSVRPRFELATTAMGEPCAAGFQPIGALDRTWLDSPLTNVVFTADPVGLISSILIITVAPARAHRSGIFPGMTGDGGERPCEFVRPTSDYRGLEFVFFLLDGEIRLDQRMRQVAAQTLALFPGAASRLVVSTRMTDADYNAIRRAQLSGFPSVVVYYRGEGVYRCQGLITADKLTAAIRDATKLHVVSDNTTGGLS